MTWKIGEVVVGIYTTQHELSPPVKKDYRYVIQNIYTCPRCKDVSFDVGFVSRKGTLTTCNCREGIPIKEVHWATHKLFKKLDTRSQEERMQEALEKEDYELAKLIQEEP
jgi:uncharacterized radical SAM superfamily Fe-S cluster-containing enzyme